MATAQQPKNGVNSGSTSTMATPVCVCVCERERGSDVWEKMCACVFAAQQGCIELCWPGCPYRTPPQSRPHCWHSATWWVTHRSIPLTLTTFHWSSLIHQEKCCKRSLTRDQSHSLVLFCSFQTSLKRVYTEWSGWGASMSWITHDPVSGCMNVPWATGKKIGRKEEKTARRQDSKGIKGYGKLYICQCLDICLCLCASVLSSDWMSGDEYTQQPVYDVKTQRTTQRPFKPDRQPEALPDNSTLDTVNKSLKQRLCADATKKMSYTSEINDCFSEKSIIVSS